MTKIYCDQCGEIIVTPVRNVRVMTLAEKEGQLITVMSLPWTVSIKLDRNLPFDLCQHCLDDVMERGFKLFLETRSTRKV